MLFTRAWCRDFPALAGIVGVKFILQKTYPRLAGRKFKDEGLSHPRMISS
ncbi:hypothetical protein [Thiothrix eikelboomii]